MLISTETKNITDFLVKRTSLSAAILAYFFKTNLFTELQLIPAIVFFTTKAYLKFHHERFLFTRRTTFYLKIEDRNDTVEDKNVNISSSKHTFKNGRPDFRGDVKRNIIQEKIFQNSSVT